MDLPLALEERGEWAKAFLLYDAVLKELNTRLEILNNEFKLAHLYNPIEHITSRLKSQQSIAKKLRHQNREFKTENMIKYINDVAGLRIICSFTPDIYRIAELIQSQSDVNVLKVKDYIANPKANGYMSYHMIVTVPIYLSGQTVAAKAEIQIRTIAMDFWASLEHKMYYKFEGNAPEQIRKELKECSDIAAYLEKKMYAIHEKIKNYTYEEAEAPPLFCSESMMESYRTVAEEETIIDVEEMSWKNKDKEDKVPFVGNIFGKREKGRK